MNNIVIMKTFKGKQDVFMQEALYLSQLWCSYNSANFTNVQSSYNCKFCSLLKLDRQCSISQTCIEFKIDCFKVLLRKSIFSFRTHLLTCDNDIVSTITKSTFYMSCQLTNKWNKLLFTFDM